MGKINAIKAVTHHGNFREEKTFAVLGGQLTSPVMMNIIQRTAYYGHFNDHNMAHDMAEELYNTGRTEYGWATFTVAKG